jgi:segregation and condensation protein B
MAMEANELRAAIEAILFVSNEPVKLEDLTDAFPDEGKEAVVAQLEEIRVRLDANIGGFTLEQGGGGWRFASRAEHDPILRKYFQKKGEGRLSIAALETLAIVAYRQPVTAPEVSDIRGVNATGVIRTLLERRMIRVAGRKNVVGSPFLYRTTRDFLIHFGLNDIRDLPQLEEFGDLIGENINEDLVAAIDEASADAEAAPDPGEELSHARGAFQDESEEALAALDDLRAAEAAERVEGQDDDVTLEAAGGAEPNDASGEMHDEARANESTESAEVVYDDSTNAVESNDDEHQH